MDSKYIGKEIILDVLTIIPYCGWIARQWDSIETDRRFKKIEEEVAQIWEIVGNNPQKPLEPFLYELINVMMNAELAPNLDFRRAKLCMIFSREISTRSKLAKANDPVIKYDECIDILKNITNVTDSDKELKLIAYELKKKDLIYKQDSINSPLGFDGIGPKEYFFCRTDNIFQDWNPRYDAKVICNLGINKEELSVQQIGEQLKWGPRRLNSALAFLHLKNLIYHDYDLDEMVGIDYILPWIRFTEEACFFLEDEK